MGPVGPQGPALPRHGTGWGCHVAYSGCPVKEEAAEAEEGPIGRGRVEVSDWAACEPAGLVLCCKCLPRATWVGRVM